MIFDSNMSAASATNWDAVQESPYALGIEGGLMHAYENECNYNAIMKAAGISELKYYKENGGDLFVQEAGAAGGLIQKFIAFFKKVIEKIKQIFKKFVMTISSYVSSDKKFVNKYKKEVFKNFKAFDMEIWNWKVGKMSKIDSDIKSAFAKLNSQTPEDLANGFSGKKITDDDVDEASKNFRSELAGESVDTDDELKDVIKENLYGDGKEEVNITASIVADQFQIISDTKTNITNTEKAQKAITDGIDKYIKKLEKARDVIMKSINTNTDSEGEVNNKTDRMTEITQTCNIYRNASNTLTVVFSMMVQAYKDQNRQAKAICVKALNSGSRKDESAFVGGDIFPGVEII